MSKRTTQHTVAGGGACTQHRINWNGLSSSENALVSARARAPSAADRCRPSLLTQTSTAFNLSNSDRQSCSGRKRESHRLRPAQCGGSIKHTAQTPTTSVQRVTAVVKVKQELYWTKFGESLAAPGAMWRGPPPPAWASGPVAKGTNWNNLGSCSSY